MKPYNYKPSKLFAKPYLNTDYLLYSFYVPNANSEDSQINKLRIFHRLLVKIHKLFDKNITGYFSFIYKSELYYWFDGEELNKDKSNFPQHALSANVLLGMVNIFLFKYKWYFLHSLSHHLNDGDKSGTTSYDEAKQYLKTLRELNLTESDVDANHPTRKLKVVSPSSIKVDNPELSRKMIDLLIDDISSKFRSTLNSVFFEISWVYEIQAGKDFNPKSGEAVKAISDLLKQHQTNKSRTVINRFNAGVIPDFRLLADALMAAMDISTENKTQAMHIVFFHFLLLYDMVDFGEPKPKSSSGRKSMEKMLTRKKRVSEEQRSQKKIEDKWTSYISKFDK